MDLKLTWEQLRAVAAPLGGYEKINITELADKYCEAFDAKDEEAKDIYFSALILRFWHRITNLPKENPTLNLDYVDCWEWIVAAISMACQPDARAWQKDSKLNAQQTISQILSTRFVAQAFYESNLKKNKGNRNLVNLDETIGIDEDGNTFGDLLADTKTSSLNDMSGTRGLIQEYINRNKLIEAIILDNIAFKDPFKYEKETIKYTDEDGIEQKYTEYYLTFWDFQLVKDLDELNTEYQEYFMANYNIMKKPFMAALDAIRKANNTKRRKYLTAVLNALKSNPDALELLRD